MNGMFGVTARTAAWLFLVAFPVLAQEGPYRSPKQEGKGPLKVFIYGGQSNMEGQGTVSAKDGAGNERNGTLVSALKDNAKAPRYKHLVDAKGDWVERDDVWVYSLTGTGGPTKGPLQLGFGWQPANRMIFGPELQSGHLIGDYYANQVLIIKYCCGGCDLQVQYRPPSSGGTVGPHYTKMVETVNRVLSDIKREFPAYDGSGYEIAGLVWWHGFNDGLSGPSIDAYEENLTHFINDFRKELKVPQLPVFIVEFTGTPDTLRDGNWNRIRKAQAATAARPEFKGTARFVETRDCVREEKDSPGGGGHHEWNNAETYFMVGDAIGQAIVKYMRESTTALTGPGPYVKLAALARQIQAGQNLGGALKTLAEKKGSADAAEAAEANTMLATLSAGAQEQLDEALRGKENDPAGAVPKLDAVAGKFAGSEFGTRAKQESDTLKKDPKVQNELRSAEMLNQLLVLERGMKPFKNGRDPKSDGFRRLNAAAIQGLMSGSQTIIQRYPGTNGARKAEELMGRYPPRRRWTERGGGASCQPWRNGDQAAI